MASFRFSRSLSETSKSQVIVTVNSPFSPYSSPLVLPAAFATQSYIDPTNEESVDTRNVDLGIKISTGASLNTCLAAAPYDLIRPPAPNFIPPRNTIDQRRTSEKQRNSAISNQAITTRRITS